jgi:CRISPR system Cascade subunit CasE
MTSLHLSRLVLRRAHDLYAIHQLLLLAVPREPRYLFRADARGEGRERHLVLLVQTMQAPDWSPLGAEIVDQASRAVLLPQAGQRYPFYLRANVTVSRKGRAEPSTRSLNGDEFRAVRGKRVALVGEEAQLSWLDRHAEAAGFAVVRRNGARELLTKNRRGYGWARGGRRARHDGVDFEGLLEVLDAERLAAAMAAGLGPAKAFGFGLLSLAPLGDRQGAPPAERA